MLNHLALGFATALTPDHLLACFAGVLLGTLIGVLPGLGPVTTIALLLPFTFSLTPAGAIIMLAGSTTARMADRSPLSWSTFPAKPRPRSRA